MTTPQKDIDWALSIEKGLQDNELTLYLEIMNGLRMSERKTEKEIRDGCILTGMFVRYNK